MPPVGLRILTLMQFCQLGPCLVRLGIKGVGADAVVPGLVLLDGSAVVDEVLEDLSLEASIWPF